MNYEVFITAAVTGSGDTVGAINALERTTIGLERSSKTKHFLIQE